jgi:type II secretory pathway pseudopilin PulG
MPQPRRKSRTCRGITIVEVAAVLSVLGMVLAVAIPTLARSVRVSKVSEASEQLDALYRETAAYYASERRDGPDQAAHCLPDAAGPAPVFPSPSPVVVNFAAPTTPGAETWRALGFAPQAALRYRYTFLPASSGCLREPPRDLTLTLRAEGDLDGDGNYSSFERRARVEAHGVLTPDQVLHIVDRIE